MARNVGKMCAPRMGDLDNDVDKQQRWDEACRRKETVRELLSRNPDDLLRSWRQARSITSSCLRISIERGRAGRRSQQRRRPAFTSPLGRGCQAPHWLTGKISAFFRGSARRGAHKSVDSRTDLSARDHRRSRILPNSSRIEGIFSARSYPRLQNARCEK